MVSERKKDAAGEWGYGEPSFIDCVAWQQMGEMVAETLHKGDLVLATGKMEQRRYETKDGEKRSVWEVTLDDIGPSLRWSGIKTKPKAVSSGDDSIPF
jgi:single-strand DNA-binding protein